MRDGLHPRGRIATAGGPMTVWKIDGQVLDANGVEHVIDDIQWLPAVTGTVVGLLNNVASGDQKKPEVPSLFIKPRSSLTGHLQDVRRPASLPAVHPEVELCVVIGHRCSGVSVDDAMSYVEGFTVINDITATNLEEGTVRPSVRAKGTDTFGPVGPFVVPRESVERPDELELQTRVNDTVVQSGGTWQYRVDIGEAIAYISSFMTLEPGDAIALGAPPERVDLQPGDVVTCSVQEVGTLVNVIVPG